MCCLVGRSSEFLQLFAGIQSCRGNLFNLIVIIIGYLPFDFLMVLNYYYHSVAIAKIVFWVAKNFRFFSLFYLVFCKWYSICSYKVGVLGPWEFFWRAGSCICLVCVSACGVPGWYECIWALWWCGRRDCTDFFLWLCRGGYGTGEMVRGVVCFFPFLPSVCCQLSWRLDVCGRNFMLYIYFFFGCNSVVFLAVFYVTRC